MIDPSILAEQTIILATSRTSGDIAKVATQKKQTHLRHAAIAPNPLSRRKSRTPRQLATHLIAESNGDRLHTVIWFGISVRFGFVVAHVAVGL